jgi:hypothetical protein
MWLFDYWKEISIVLAGLFAILGLKWETKDKDAERDPDDIAGGQELEVVMVVFVKSGDAPHHQRRQCE